MSLQIILPSYSIGKDCFESIKDVCNLYGKTCVIVHGEKAFNAAKQELIKEIENAGITIHKTILYGKDATYENVDRIKNDVETSKVDFIFAVGGGKCVDTTKVVGDMLNKPVITIPTIASTCAAVTKISIMYTNEGIFKDIYHCKKAPVYCLINTNIIMNAPLLYLWAGIGDTIAKNVETHFSCRNDEIEYKDELALEVSNLCFDSIIKHGGIGYKDAENKKLSPELETTIQNILISTGIVSLIINPDYNSALAHSLFYGLTCRKEIEQNHLHGEVVSYGVLVQLMVDNQMDKLEKAYHFYKEIKLPVCLNDLDLNSGDPLDDVISLTLQNKELNHIPYPITKEMIVNAIQKLEDRT